MFKFEECLAFNPQVQQCQFKLVLGKLGIVLTLWQEVYVKHIS